jgi:CRP-like cAMP-binding protein
MRGQAALQARRVIVEQGKKSNAVHHADRACARHHGRQPRPRGDSGHLQPGDYIGEMSLIDNEPHSATVRAEIQTDVLMLGASSLRAACPRTPPWPMR